MALWQNSIGVFVPLDAEDGDTNCGGHNRLRFWRVDRATANELFANVRLISESCQQQQSALFDVDSNGWVRGRPEVRPVVVMLVLGRFKLRRCAVQR
jgi:hypothetical protein